MESLCCPFRIRQSIMCVLVGSVQFCLYHITLVHQSFNVLFVIVTLSYTSGC